MSDENKWKIGDNAFYGESTMVIDGFLENGMVLVRHPGVSEQAITVDPDDLEPIAPKPKTKTEAYAAALGIKPEVFEPITFTGETITLEPLKVHLSDEELTELGSLQRDGENYDLWMEELAGVPVLMVEIKGDHDPERWLIVGGGKVRLGR